MNYFIIIRGPLGIGKTTIAQELTKTLNAEHISIDKIMEENGLNKEDNDYTAEDFVKANEYIIDKAKNLVQRGKIVIFDGCFYHKEQIEDLIKKLNFKHFIFTLKAPLTVCIERDKNRKLTYGEDACQAVYSLVSKFDYGTIINTENKSITEIVNEITLRLK